jgi:hypothetical protein
MISLRTDPPPVVPIQELSLDAFVADVRRGLSLRTLAPYLGPGVAELTTGSPMPLSYDALAQYLGTRVALPRRAKGNPWASAQYIESTKHRATLVAMLRDAFQGTREPLRFHHYLAGLGLPLIIDTWYDGTFRQALSGRQNWAEIQASDRTGVAVPEWFRAYDSAGNGVSVEQAAEQATLLYTPHGSIQPSGRFLLSDADYVEVLTEIDIQTPIPGPVRTRRSELGFVFFGCRFHDQLLRTFARQITKRSLGPNYAIFSARNLTRMEERFVRELDMKVLFAPLESVLDALTA